jgi:aerobic-type carbon monoxide dehydrogenase small subunit (CoxS/CutS family)
VLVTLSVNGEPHALVLDPAARLADVLRDDLHLTGTKIGCGEGACGACAVLVDGEPVNACLMLAAAAEGHEIVTIEGISSDGLTPLQQAFLQEDALQCGYCTAGQIVTATALLRRVPSPTPGQVRDALAGNLCRCGCYVKIERAVLSCAEGGA